MADAADRSLAGISVLVTRPAEQADGLCALIEAAGGRARRLPLLAIAPTGNAAAQAALSQPEQWDWVIFLSANAVRWAPAIDRWPRRPRPRLAAIGAATAAALRAAGLPVDLIPEPQFNTESLLANPALRQVAGARILIVRGVGGRELLAEVLGQRGAEIAYAEVYRRIRPTVDAAALIELWRGGGVDAVVATSGETLQHLMELLGPVGAEFADRTPLVVIGTRLAELARRHGWRRVLVAEPASDRGIADALRHCRRPPPGGLPPASEST
ncbi:uroporphyrinogen-III synthase [Candidatus Methylocalor cossyra]|uniref:Uroporphyrinogen-III synthase n=1 Tax=Candidatus Methylocalor cossyra TaxID=3108543 RepID=A0ABP1CBC5_9GAMM